MLRFANNVQQTLLKNLIKENLLKQNKKFYIEIDETKQKKIFS